MKRLLAAWFRASLLLFPRGFRSAFGPEMSDVFEERISELRSRTLVLVAVRDIIGVVVAGGTLRLAGAALPRPLAMAAITVAALTLLLIGDGGMRPGITAGQDRIDFTARDPAGEFTLTIVGGRPVAASLDRISLPEERLSQAGDSIRIHAPGGRVVLALAYHRDSGRIEWEARPAACRANPLDCGGYR